MQELLVRVTNDVSVALGDSGDECRDAALGANKQLFLFTEAAYAMIVAFLSKDIGAGEKVEGYQYEDRQIALRYWPVDTVTRVALVDNIQLDKLTDVEYEEVLIPVDDYELRRNKLLVIKSVAGQPSLSNWRFVTGTDLDAPARDGVNVVVEYRGGWDEDTLPRAVRTALVQQTLVLFNRRQAAGLAQITHPNDASIRMDAYDVDSGDIIDGIKTMLEPYVYRGRAVELDV